MSFLPEIRRIGTGVLLFEAYDWDVRVRVRGSENTASNEETGMLFGVESSKSGRLSHTLSRLAHGDNWGDYVPSAVSYEYMY